MSTSRLTFLYPHLLRAARTSVTPSSIAARWVATTRSKSSFAPRHGKAVEPTWDNLSQDGLPQPQPPPSEADTPATEKNILAAQQAQSDGEAKPVEAKRIPAEQAGSPELEQTQSQPQPQDTVSVKTAAATAPQPKEDGLNKAKPGKIPEQNKSAAKEEVPSSPSLDAVLHMPSPERIEHPHMTPPPYVHHFDSYSLVKQLEEGGYTRDQAVSSMKAIRKILAGNLDVAQKSLVSKSDVENETYLFHAACSELGTEIKNNRRLQEEQMRQQRTHLQHEVDILTQTLNQELLTLNDSVRGLFNDRNMTVREEQKAVESAIQQINYKMSILLSSDSKSEIEGVRWVLIRRSVVGLVFLAIITLGMIRYATYLAQQKKKEADKRKKERERLKKDGGRTDNSAPADAAVILSAS
ncbi:hypothetical protein QQS21_009391 [Conoideocrella luteorostrata]|uniref:MOZ protein represents a chromatin-associated acetyltransferase n=1 Tax=Conoideocrella luteorostrata TaxID=1105319 RepID=A0AAJ0CLD9_9HYPO|nr:hypothetical protein QQS21_009391 [Conoideocrella luteorostrata]